MQGFQALHHRGYRIYFTGMLARGTAVWVLFVSIPWLAVEGGASAFELGIISASLFLPALFLSPLSGVLADRVNRSSVLLVTQAAAAVHASVLAASVYLGLSSVPMLITFALLFGVITAAELPVRQSFLTDLVPIEEVPSAVSLHATAWNVTRFIGPAVAGGLIATVGVVACFVLSAVASVVVAGSIWILRRFRRHARPASPGSASVIRSLGEGVRFATRDARIRWAMFILSAAGVLGVQAFQTLAPLYTSRTLGLGGGGYGAFMAVWGAGALAGTFAVTMFARGDRRPWLLGGAAGLAVLLGALALTSWPPLAFALAGALGFAQISTIQNAMITVQQAATDRFRGRVMGLYTTVFQGTNPIGAVLAGVLAGTLGISAAMLLGAGGLAAVTALARLRMRN